MRLVVSLLVLSAAVTVFRPAQVAAYGLSVDFGTNGIAVAAPGAARGVALLPDGRIVAAGSTDTSVALLARFLPDGTLDPSFGTGGVVVSPALRFVQRLARQADGKLVIVGKNGAPNDHFVVARFLEDGALDPSFGTDGVVVTDFDHGSTDLAYGVAMQSDGKIVVSGKSSDMMALARYETDGTLDQTFGVGGLVRIPAVGTDIAYRVTMQPDGKIVAGGYADPGKPAFLVARFLTNGLPDPSFGENGRVVTRWSSRSRVGGLVVQPDGKIVAGGDVRTKGGNFGVVRYESDGRLDTGFGNGGLAVTEITSALESVYTLARRADGVLVVGGVAIDRRGPVARLTADGRFERDYGVCGTAIAEMSVYDSAVEPGGAVIVAGYYQGNLAVGRFGVAAPALCPETPASGCKAGGGSITIANGTKPKLAWQWRGQATTVEELGSTATDDYTMCVYDESTPIPEVVYRARVTGGTQCGESTCWKTLPDGAKYRDKFGTPCGIDAITLRAGGDGAAAVAVKGRGPLLGSAGLPFASPTRVQMHASSGACWESVFSASAVQANSATKYVAKAP